MPRISESWLQKYVQNDWVLMQKYAQNDWVIMQKYAQNDWDIMQKYAQGRGGGVPGRQG